MEQEENKQQQQLPDELIENKEHGPDDSLVRCPCCGQYTLKKPIKPNGELVDQWLACVSTGIPFSNTYRLYGGKLLITAVQPSASTGAELAYAAAIINRAIDDSTYTGLQSTELQSLNNAISLYSCIRDITFTTPSRKTYNTGAAWDQAIALLREAANGQRAKDDTWQVKLESAYKILTDKDNVSSLPTGVLLAVGQTHIQLTDVLMSAGFDKDFWRGIELA